MKGLTGIALLFASVLLVTGVQPCLADVNEAENVFEEFPERMFREFEPTEEMIDRFMDGLKEAEPEKAEELAKLREKEPEKFNEEIKNVMREHFRQMFRGQWERGGPGGFVGGPEGRGERGPEGRERGPRRGDMMARFAELQEKFLVWLKENYAEETKKLAEIKEKNPELYDRQIHLLWMKYGRIFMTAQENPELAEILKQQNELNRQRDELMRKIGKAKDEKEKGKLVDELGEVLGKKFDLIVRRKQIAFEQLRERLAELEKQVKESEAKVERWQKAEFKQEQIKSRLAELVGKSEKFDWN
jgi:hypothetical protein